MPGKALVTGGAGFIGSHVARELLSMRFDVVVLDDLSGGFAENVPQNCDFVQGSILDHDLIEKLFQKHRFDYVFHLAAYAAEGLSHFIKRFNYSNNLIGSVNLINASVNYAVKCFVFTSSIAVYGATQVPMTETATPMPEDPYGIAKYAVELDLKESHEMFGLNYIIFRPHNVYGERQNIADTYRNVVGIFMNQIMHGEPMTIFGDGEQTRAFTYIADVAPLIAHSIEKKQAYNHVFGLGADQPCTINRLAAIVADAMSVKPNVVYLDPRNEVTHAYASHDKVHKVFGPRQYCPLENGIAKMAEWAKRVGARKGHPFANIEVPRNLPPSWAALCR